MPQNCLSVDASITNANITGVDSTGWIITVVLGFMTGIIILLILYRFKRKSFDPSKFPKLPKFPNRKYKTNDSSSLKEVKTDKNKKRKTLDLSSMFATGPGVSDNNLERLEDYEKERCLMDAFLCDNIASADAALLDNDLEAMDDLEADLSEEYIMTLIQILRIILSDRELSEEETNEMIENITKESKKEMDEIKQMNQDKKITKNEYNDKINEIIKKQQVKIKSEINDNNKINKNEAGILLTKFDEQVKNIDQQRNIDRDKQEKAIEERLAKRKKLLNETISESVCNSRLQELKERRTRHETTLNQLLDDEKLDKKTVDNIMSSFDKKQLELKKKLDNNESNLKKQLFEKLKKQKETELEKLAKSHLLEKKELSNELENGSVDISKLNNMYTAHRIEKLELENNIDEKEKQSYLNLQSDIYDNDQVELDKLDQECYQMFLSVKSDIDIEDLIENNKKHMEEYKEKQKIKKKKLIHQYEKEAEENKNKYKKQVYNVQKEHEQMVQCQKESLEKVISSQQLDGDSKDVIMKNHEENMNSMNSKLSVERKRQQKMLEARMLKQQGKIADLKEKQETIEFENKRVKQKEFDELKENIEKEIALAEKNAATFKNNRLIEMKELHIERTQQLLADNDQKISNVIGGLQAVESRRLARIKKQEDEIIQLKERMKQRESVEEGEGSEELKIIPEKESDSSADSDEADQLIEKMNEQEKMNIRNLSANREKQRQIMEKRLQAKKNKQNAKAKRRATHSLNVGKSLTGKILENSIFKNKQNNMFRQLSKELHSEAEIIKKEMQLDLDKQLKEQNQQFIQQLSKLGNISISQLKEINESLQELDTS